MASKGLWVGPWLHEPPEISSKNGKLAVIKRLCFGPVESQTWYALEDGRFCRESHFLEGLQAGECHIDFISWDELQKALQEEAALCEHFGNSVLSALFQKEADLLL